MSVTNRRLFDVIIRVGPNYRRGRCAVCTTCYSCNVDWNQETSYSIGDTDVMVLALYFNNDLKTNGLSELWMRAGVGDSTRYIPLHLIFEMNPELCSVLPAIHILTGCDTTSKVGTKLSALKSPAAQLLSEFGKSLSSPNQDEIIHKAEQYLVQVLKPNST